MAAKVGVALGPLGRGSRGWSQDGSSRTRRPGATSLRAQPRFVRELAQGRVVLIPYKAVIHRRRKALFRWPRVKAVAELSPERGCPNERTLRHSVAWLTLQPPSVAQGLVQSWPRDPVVARKTKQKSLGGANGDILS